MNNRIYKSRLTIMFLMLLVFIATGEDFGPSWVTFMDDDGRFDKEWVMLSNPSPTLRKEIILDVDPAPASQAVLEYLIAANPYFLPSKTYLRGDMSKVSFTWANLIIKVNDIPILDQSAGPYIGKGIHRINVPVAILKEGVNIVDFRWKKAPPGNPNNWQYGYIYFSVEVKEEKGFSHSFISSSHGKNFKPNCIKKGRCEYIVRLRVKIL